MPKSRAARTVYPAGIDVLVVVAVTVVLVDIVVAAFIDESVLTVDVVEVVLVVA